MDCLIVGAGFAGATCARQLAEAGRSVTVVDKRPHIGGNAHDRLDSAGVLVHQYGPHIFHTNSEKVVEFLSRFTEWRPYEHRVLRPDVDGRLLPCRSTADHQPAVWPGTRRGRRGRLPRKARSRESRVLTSEDVVLNSVGPDLCDKFFRGYTRKQWGSTCPSCPLAWPRASRTEQRRRPLFHRPLPGHAAAGLHRDVRAHAGPPADRRAHRHRFRAEHEPVRRRSSSQDPSTSTTSTGSASCPTARCASSTNTCPRGPVAGRGHRELPQRSRVHAHHGVQAPDGTGHSGTSLVREFPCADG